MMPGRGFLWSYRFSGPIHSRWTSWRVDRDDPPYYSANRQAPCGARSHPPCNPPRRRIASSNSFPADVTSKVNPLLFQPCATDFAGRW